MEKGLTLPESEVFERYNNQYVAVIESETKPPISENNFSKLQVCIPTTLEFLAQELRNEPDRDEYAIQSLKWRLYNKIYDEVESNVPSSELSKLRDYMDELVDAVFGKANFEGEVLEVDLPLDQRKIFFPLGTSGGWPNDVGDIDILFKVPKDIALDLPHSKDAFFQDSHWYLVQMKNSNPDFDLESFLKPLEKDHKTRMEQAAFLYDNSQSIGLITTLVILMILWFGVALCLKITRKEKEEKVLKNPMLWLLLGLSLIISIPGALLVLLLMKPKPIHKLPKEFLPSTLLILYFLSIVVFLLGVPM